MAKLYFKYGAMGSSKTATALMTAYNYRERGQKVVVLKPQIENRDGEKTIKSRIGLETECEFVEDFIYRKVARIKEYDCIIVDECQFCTKKQIEYFAYIVDELDVPVLCFGLRTDFLGNLFEGSQHLMAWADKIEEIKTMCWCGQKAIMNVRIDEAGNMVTQGEQISMGGNDKYISLCRKHYRRGMLRKEQ